MVRTPIEPEGGRAERVSTRGGYSAAGLLREMQGSDPTIWVRGKG